MMISTKGRYALKIMIDLAQHREEGYVSLKAVSQRQEISVKYLEMIVGILNRAGLVDSMRGKSGGYKLNRKTEEYTVGEILRLTEDGLVPVNCMGCQPDGCVKGEGCLTLPIWMKLDKVINDYLESITLADVVKNNKELL